jgi:hypothetical protein
MTLVIRTDSAGRTRVLGTGSYRGSPILAQTNLDICLHAGMGFHLYIPSAQKQDGLY